MKFVLLNYTHFKRKRAHKIERSLKCTEWKSALKKRCLKLQIRLVSYFFTLKIKLRWFMTSTSVPNSFKLQLDQFFLALEFPDIYSGEASPIFCHANANFSFKSISKKFLLH